MPKGCSKTEILVSKKKINPRIITRSIKQSSWTDSGQILRLLSIEFLSLSKAQTSLLQNAPLRWGARRVFFARSDWLLKFGILYTAIPRREVNSGGYRDAKRRGIYLAL